MKTFSQTTPSRFEIIDGQLYCRLGKEVRLVPSELQEELWDTAIDYFSTTTLQPPKQLDLPFFSYGLFKPGQLGFGCLREYVENVETDVKVKGRLFERDGVPLFVRSCTEELVFGAVINFSPGRSRDAYMAIASLEPEKQYGWGVETTTTGAQVNILVSAPKNTNGAEHIENCEWDGRADPHFTQALTLVESITQKSPSGCDTGSVKRLMELQMAYMLLWTAIERYTSLRYHLRKKVMAKILCMADEPAFREALKKYATEENRRQIYSTDGGGSSSLSFDNPKKSLKYYYQIRSTVTHRGKALMTDAILLIQCINELLAIFREVLEQAFQDSEWHEGASREDIK